MSCWDTEISASQLGQSFTELRRNQIRLDGEDNALIALSYGARIAADRSSLSEDTSLLLEAKGNPTYLRDNHQELRSLIRAVCPAPSLLVNSKFSLKKIKAAYPSLVPQNFETTCSWSEKGQGLWSLTPDSATEPFVHQLPALLVRVGATPSLYAILGAAVGKNTTAGGAQVPRPETTGIVAKLEALLAGARSSAQTGRTQHLRLCAAAMVGGLLPLLPAQPSQTLLVSLYWMERALRAILASPSLLLLVRLFEVVTDEVFLVLQILRPYSEGAIRQALKDSLFTRILPLENPRFEANVFLFSSGMDALSSALTVAASHLATQRIPASIASVKAENEYVETSYLCEELRTAGPASIIVAILNPSVPRSCVSVDDLLAAVRESLAVYPGCVLILDVTIETDTDDLQSLLLALQSNLTGRVVLMLCKSYCKYATFGAAKVSGGGLFLFASPDLSHLRSNLGELEAGVGWAQQADAQFLAHLTTPGVMPPTLEPLFVRRAADAAAAAHRIWAEAGGLKEEPWHMHSLPFLVRDRQLRLVPLLGQGASLPLGKAAAKMQFEDRDSFASLRTSFLELPTAVRFNTGLEDEAALRELFYAVALLTGPAPPATFDSALELAAGTALYSAGFEACSPAGQQQVASVLLLACQVWAPPLLALPGADSELEVLLTRLIQFLSSSPEFVTAETLDNLRAYWLRLCLHLPAARAASVPALLSLLPSYRAVKVWATCPGDLAGEEATFLRGLLPGQCAWLAGEALKAGQPQKAQLCLTYCPGVSDPGLQAAISQGLAVRRDTEVQAAERRAAGEALVAAVEAALVQPAPAAAVAQALHHYAEAIGDVDAALGTLAGLPLPPLVGRLAKTRGLWSPNWPLALVRSAVEKALKA